MVRECVCVNVRSKNNSKATARARSGRRLVPQAKSLPRLGPLLNYSTATDALPK